MRRIQPWGAPGRFMIKSVLQHLLLPMTIPEPQSSQQRSGIRRAASLAVRSSRTTAQTAARQSKRTLSKLSDRSTSSHATASSSKDAETDATDDAFMALLTAAGSIRGQLRLSLQSHLQQLLQTHVGQLRPPQTKTISKKQTQSVTLLSLPNEMLMSVFERCETADLLRMRSVSRHCNALSRDVLARRLRTPAKALAETTSMLASALHDLSKSKAPLLAHYRQFLVGIQSSEITEATWYSSPPQELQTVCECLCILRGVSPLPSASLPNPPPLAGPGRFAMPWTTIKRTMSRYDFKAWILGLQRNVETIHIADVRRVEDIIRMDQAITYERLRDVSLAGYKLLIVIAACLQYVSIFDEISVRRDELALFETKYDRTRKFLAALGDSLDLPPLPHGQNSVDLVLN